jgi:hypothetical protein
VKGLEGAPVLVSVGFTFEVKIALELFSAHHWPAGRVHGGDGARRPALPSTRAARRARPGRLRLRRCDGRAAVELIRIKTLAEAGMPLDRIRVLLDAEPGEFGEAVTQVDEALKKKTRDHPGAAT